MAAREDVLPDEVRGRAVRLIALVRLRYGLHGRTCAGVCGIQTALGILQYQNIDLGKPHAVPKILC